MWGNPNPGTLTRSQTGLIGLSQTGVHPATREARSTLQTTIPTRNDELSVTIPLIGHSRRRPRPTRLQERQPQPNRGNRSRNLRLLNPRQSNQNILNSTLDLLLLRQQDHKGEPHPITFLSSRAAAPLTAVLRTQIKAAYKSTLQDPDHDPNQSAPNKAGGNRTAWQVASNAAFGAACALAFRHLAASTPSFHPTLPLLAPRPGLGLHSWSPALILGAISFWSACAGDTFASELGILSSAPPRLVTTLRTVPKGTNGGVSPWGLLMSLAGGLVVGTASAVSLALEDKAGAGLLIGGWPSWVVVIGVAGASGVVGSLIDSVLGATVQETVYSPSRGKIVHHREAHRTEALQVRGYSLLSNNGVNVVSSVATAAGVMWAVRRWA